MPRKTSIPSERALFATYKLWRKYVDPDGLVSASEFREMDEDEKREAFRELGGAQPVTPEMEEADDDEQEDAPDAHADEEEDAHDETGGRFVELTDDLIDPRSTDPFS